jgi:hypothetical protein
MSDILPGVRRLLVVIAFLLAAAVLPVQAAAEDSGKGTLRGAVYNTTCYGPCRYPPPPPPLYTGDDLVVTVRHLPDRRLVAVLRPKEGRFRIQLRSGAYRVRSFIRDGGKCWEGEARDVKVAENQVTTVRLRVHNACIL